MLWSGVSSVTAISSSSLSTSAFSLPQSETHQRLLDRTPLFYSRMVKIVTLQGQSLLYLKVNKYVCIRFVLLLKCRGSYTWNSKCTLSLQCWLEVKYAQHPVFSGNVITSDMLKSDKLGASVFLILHSHMHHISTFSWRISKRNISTYLGGKMTFRKWRNRNSGDSVKKSALHFR